MKCCEQQSPVHDQAGLDSGPLDQQTSTKPTELPGRLSHGRVARLVGWLFWVKRPFETIFQSISSRLPKRGRKRRKDR